MFCPRCAAQNLDDAKFCRGCGTNLEPIALALRGHPQPARAGEQPEETWVEKRREGIKKLVRAGGLLPSSLLIGAALGFFSNDNQHVSDVVRMIQKKNACCGPSRK